MSSRTYSSSSSSSSSCSSFEQACSSAAPSPQLSTCSTLQAAFEVPAFTLNNGKSGPVGGSISGASSASTSSASQSPKISAEVHFRPSHGSQQGPLATAWTAIAHMEAYVRRALARSGRVASSGGRGMVAGSSNSKSPRTTFGAGLGEICPL